MIQQISQERQLTKYTTHKIQDEGIEVSIDPLLSPDDYIAIKVDDYYNGLHLAKTTPKAIDFLVAVDCSCQDYVLYLLELKLLRHTRPTLFMKNSKIPWIILCLRNFPISFLTTTTAIVISFSTLSPLLIAQL